MGERGRVGRSPATSGAVHGTVWNPGTTGSRLLPMRNQFQFRAGSPPAMPVAKAARLAPEITWRTERASRAVSAHMYALIQAERRTIERVHARTGFSARELSKEEEQKRVR